MSRIAIGILFLATTALAAQEAPKPEELHTVATGPIKVEVELDGVLEAEKSWPVEVRLKAWPAQSLEVVDPAIPGASVKKGDTLMTFKTEDLDRVIRDAELAEAGAKVALENARHDLILTERSVAIDLAGVQRTYDRAKYDTDYYAKVSRPLNEKSSEDRLKQAQHTLEYAAEELHQLEKMYKEDDLTEETEEIILLRQKRQVEFAKNFVEQAKDNHVQMVKMAIPRRQEDLVTGLDKGKIDLDRANATLPLKIETSRQALAKAELIYNDAVKRLRELRQDRDLLTVRSPGDGVVYFGRCDRGRWSDGGNVSQSMKPGGGFRPGLPFLTIVATQPLFVRADVPEAYTAKLHEKAKGWITLTAYPYEPASVSIRSLTPLSAAPNQLDLAAGIDTKLDRLAPGMTGKLKFIAYEKADALKLPLAAVKSDAPGDYHVFVKSADGTFQRRNIKLGQRTATEAEVLEGLTAGEQIHPRGEPSK